MVELRGLHRYFGSLKAVNDVSFQFGPGQVFGFIGPNGAGKTTAMRILATIDVPTKGDAFVDGYSVVNDADRVRRLIGFMPDHFATYANVNCWEYLDFFARGYGLRGKARLTAVRRVMSFTELDELAEKPIDSLSKGMKQRLCLARALVHDPKVLILDEPAAGLDPRARIELRELIKLLGGDGKAVLISSHILTELAEMCDRVGIIELGRIVATGPVNAIQATERPVSLVEIRVLRDIDSVERWLREQPDVGEVQSNGRELVVHFSADEEAQAGLLQRMAAARLPVVGFRSRNENLEDVFMAVTKGKMQ
ncbi:MAG: ABC transporter ATP-binding protein [Planctomycetes bacterium]|nr:ABC transporter ATP-binding protein [Planctomycetota bacterium]